MRTIKLKILCKKVSYMKLCIALELVLFLEIVDNVVPFDTENFWENELEQLVEWKVSNAKNCHFLSPNCDTTCCSITISFVVNCFTYFLINNCVL